MQRGREVKSGEKRRKMPRLPSFSITPSFMCLLAR